MRILNVRARMYVRLDVQYTVVCVHLPVSLSWSPPSPRAAPTSPGSCDCELKNCAARVPRPTPAETYSS